MIDKLLLSGAKVNVTDNGERETPLHAAAFSGLYEVVDRLLSYGANVNAVNRLGETALHAAANEKDTRVVNKLLTFGAYVNAVDNQGSTPLHEAALFGRLGMVERLVEEGADIEQENNKGETALDMARKPEGIHPCRKKPIPPERQSVIAFLENCLE